MTTETRERPPFWPPVKPDGTPNHEQMQREAAAYHRSPGLSEQKWCNDCRVYHIA